MHPLTIEEWFKIKEKSLGNVFIMWKTQILAFDVISEWITSNIGNERRVRMGQDPWIHILDSRRLPKDTIVSLMDQGYQFLE